MTKVAVRIRKDKDGYILHVNCGLGHSGNRRLAPAGRGFFACHCGKFYARREVEDRLTNPGGENMGGWLYTL